MVSEVRQASGPVPPEPPLPPVLPAPSPPEPPVPLLVVPPVPPPLVEELLLDVLVEVLEEEDVSSVSSSWQPAEMTAAAARTLMAMADVVLVRMKPPKGLGLGDVGGRRGE